MKHQVAVVGGVVVYGAVSWLLGVGGRASLLAAESGRASLLAAEGALGPAGTVATVFVMVALGFVLMAYIIWAQNDFK